MTEIIIATGNKGKAREFERIFGGKGIVVKTLLDFPEIGDVEETGTTFEENARIKAEAVSSLLGKPVIADDSGLEVDALGGRPGVYSARYAGEAKDDNANMDKLLSELAGIAAADRTARFRCVLAFSIPGEQTKFFKGKCEGQIAFEKRGEFGFGYDPVFIPENSSKTMAEIPPEEKNKISHRAMALGELEENLPDLKWS